MHFLPYPHLKLDKKATVRAIVVTFTGLFLSIILCFYIKEKTEQEDRLRLAYEAEILSRRIITWLEQYKGVLLQTRAFILNTDKFDPEKLNNYIEDTEVFKRYTGLQGIGYIQVIPPDRIKEFNKEFPKVEVWPKFDYQGELTPILGLYPSNYRNDRMIGFNMSSETIRRTALEKARDMNSMTATGKVILTQETGDIKPPAFIFVLPLYKKGFDISTTEGRRKAISGYIYSPFRTYDLFDAMFSKLNMIVDIEIYDTQELNQENLFYDYNTHSLENAEGVKLEMPVTINGMELTLVFTPLHNFPLSYNPYSLVLLFLLGSSVTFIALWTYLITTKQVMEARRVATQRQGLLLLEKKHVKERDEFLSIASHELKTPLTSLKLQSQIMLRNLNKGDDEILNKEKITSLVHLLDVQTSRLNRLVDDMLDISRLRTGKLQINLTEMDLKEVTEGVIEKLLPQILEATSAAPTVEIYEHISGNWDRLRIEQVITNLLTNAIRYGQNKPIKIRVFKESNFACIQVIDQGRGISPENFQKIYDRFERAGMSANESSGMGLGLYIAKQIVDAHHGTISLESELQKGSTFTVKIPL